MRASDLLDAEGRSRIEAAVRTAERTTTGEIVVAVVTACDEYGSAGWRLAALFAGLALLGVGVFAPPVSVAVLLLAQVAAAALGHLLARLARVRRLFVTEAAMQEAAERRASATFARHGLHRTRDGTGILLLVALFEHRVVVLADEGVNRRLDPDESWQDVVELALAGIRRGEPISGLEAAVARCGEILAHPLPAGADLRDEIAQALVVED